MADDGGLGKDLVKMVTGCGVIKLAKIVVVAIEAGGGPIVFPRR